MRCRFLILISLMLSLAHAAIVDVPEGLPLSVLQLRDLIIIAVVLSYVFACGKIADFLQTSGRQVSKKEVLVAPLAYLLFASFGVLLYFSSGAWLPPQSTIITMIFYLVGIPLAIAIGMGALALKLVFRERLSPAAALDLSLRVILAPVFDGLKGYWTAFGAAALLAGISAVSFYSSGANLASIPLDFLLLSSAVALYYLYRAATVPGNEGKASSIVTAFTVLAPALLRQFFSDLVCSALAAIPFSLFQSCPLEQAASEVTLAVSVFATMLLLLPVIPFVYALSVNVLRFLTVMELLLRREAKPKKQRE